jgi:hypothetical protein
MIKPPKGIIRNLPDSDPRSWNYPSQREGWLKLAYALGQLLAKQDWEKQNGMDIENEDGGSLRTVLNRSAKRPLH